MKKHNALLYVILFCLLAFDVEADNRHFVPLQASQFFSDEEVNSICKDAHGVLWVATSNGLNCFDGYETTLFYHDEAIPFSLPDNNIFNISIAPNNLFLLTTSTGYSFFDPISHSVVKNSAMEVYNRMLSIAEIHQMYSDKDYIWFCLQGFQDIKRYDCTSQEFRTFSFAKEDGYIIDKADNQMLFLTSKGRVLGLENNTLVIKADFSKSHPVNDQAKLYVDKVGTYYYYLSGGKGVVRYFPSTQRYDRVLTDYIINDLLLDNNGLLWVATDHAGVLIVHPINENENSDLKVESSHSIPHNNILCLFEDNHNVMWLGGYKRGVAYHVNKQVDYVRDYLGVSTDNLRYVPDVTAVLPTEKGCWLGTNEHGLLLYNQNTNRVEEQYNSYTSTSISSNVVVSLCEDDDNSLWIGQFWGGLAHLKNGKVTQYKNIPGNHNSLSSNNVWDIYQDEDQMLWLATLGGGLQRFNPKENVFTTYKMDQHKMLPSDVLYSISPGNDDVLYIGTSNGVCAFHRKTQTFEYIGDAQFKAHMMNRNIAIQVYYDSRGLLWVLTRTQVYVYDTKRETLIDLPFLKNKKHTKFSGIIEDNDGHICIACANQVWLVSVTENQEEVGLYSFELRAYGRQNYIQNSAFNQRAIGLDIKGRFWIGGGKGVTCLYPEKMKDYTEYVHVYLKDLYLKGRKISVGDEYNGRVLLEKSISELSNITLEYNENVFSISAYTSHVISAPEQQFEYWLTDVQEQWVPIKKGLNEIHFMNLEPGDYTLKLRLHNPTGYYQSNQVKLNIHVRPPMWLTWWAYCLYVVLFILLILSAFMLVRHHLQQKYQILQLSYEAQKEKELTKLKLQFFTDISHEIRTPLSLILGPLQRCLNTDDLGSVRKQMKIMQQHGTYLMNLVNQILDYRKIDASGTKVNLQVHDISDQILEVVNKFKFTAEQQQAELLVEGPQSLSCVYDSDLVEKILTNLLSNALKYGGENVCVQVKFATICEENADGMSSLNLTIIDNGPGIPTEDQPFVFNRFYRNGDNTLAKSGITGTGIGLYLVKKYVEVLGGSITLHHNENEANGCVFSITIPVTIEKQECRIKNVQISSANTLEKSSGISELVVPVHNELVLIVDDDDDFREYLLDTLKTYYHLESAADGVEAWEIIPTLMPDIIILDKMMPKMDGVKLCQLIKQDVRTAHIPVIMLTACTDDESRVEVLSLGADDYISKPFDWDVLNLRIEYLLDKNRLQQEKFQYRAYVEPNRMDLSASDELFLTNALRYVQDHLRDDNLSVEILSNELGISRAHLYKKLTFITGKSPVEFIRLVRLKTAAHLLKQGEMNVSEVSYAVGFNTPKYFSKQFKEVYKVSPSSYIKEEE